MKILSPVGTPFLALFLGAALLAAPALLSGCFEGGGTETGNAGAIEGKVHDGGGTETGNTEVFLVSIKYQGDGSDSGTFRSVRTDAKGSFLFKNVDAGRYALGIPGGGETPMSALRGRITTIKDAKAAFNLTVRPSLALIGRVLPEGGQSAASVRVCVPGLMRCADVSADSTWRLADMPVGAYELVVLSPAHAHYLSIQVQESAAGTAYLRDLALKSAADADHVPYAFYDVGRSLSFSSLPMRYAPGAEPAWYAGKDFSQVEYFLLSEAAAPKAWNGDFFTHAYRDSLVLAGPALLGADLTAPLAGFPLPARLTAANFDFAKSKAGGADLIVTDGAGAVLAHQVERWDSAAAKADIWIRFPTLAAAAASRKAVLRWNRDSAVPPPPPGGTVFRRADGFIGAWHLGEAGNDSLVQDAQGIYPGRLRGAVPAGGFAALRGEGVIGNAYRFGAKNWIHITPDSTQDVTRTFTVAMWVKLNAQDTVSKALFASKWAPNRREWHFHIHPSRSLEFEFADAQGAIAGAWRSVAPLAALNTWHHYAGTFDNGVVKLYVDGVEVAGVLAPDVPNFRSGTIPKAITRFGSAVNLGTNTIDHILDLDGDLDEFWYSTEAKSPDWIRAAYESQKPR